MVCWVPAVSRWFLRLRLLRSFLRLILASGLVIMTGIIFLLAAATRMGNVTDFIAKPVLRGFTFGLAIVIIIKQSTSVLNISVQKDNLFLFILDVLRQFRSWTYACLAATALALVFLALMEWLRRIRNGQFRNIPSGTLVIIAGIVAGKVFDLPSYGIPDVGSIELNLNNPILPDLSYPEWMQLFEIGIALVFILYAESYGSIRSFAMKHHDTIYPNRDLSLWEFPTSSPASSRACLSAQVIQPQPPTKPTVRKPVWRACMPWPSPWSSS